MKWLACVVAVSVAGVTAALAAESRRPFHLHRAHPLQWYRKIGFVGCSSHSGRRSFITQAARKVSLVGGSLRDVQALAGHASLTSTSRYIAMDAEAQRKLVNII
jgi:integrase